MDLKAQKNIYLKLELLSCGCKPPRTSQVAVPELCRRLTASKCFRERDDVTVKLTFHLFRYKMSSLHYFILRHFREMLL